MRRRLGCEQLEPRFALFADLVPALVDLPDRAAIGSAVSVSVDIDNTGNQSSGTYVVEFRLSTDAAITRTDRLLASVTRSAISAGLDSRWTQTLTLPSDLAPGTYTLGVVVDPLNKITENSEANNSLGDTTPSTLFRNSLTGNVTYGTSTKSVAIRPLIVGAELYSDRPTWIIVHGRNSSPASTGVAQIGAAIEAEFTNDQVLVLDWSAAAASGFFSGSGENYIKPVAAWAASALVGYGITADEINVVGHSWGAYVAAELGERLGEVNSIMALDPATDFPGGSYNPEATVNGVAEVDFARNSGYSWAFYESANDVYGSAKTSATADESFVVRNSDHSKLVQVVANVISQDLGTSLIAAQFDLQRLLNAAANPVWAVNQFNTGGTRQSGQAYEGVLYAASGGITVQSLTYVDVVSSLLVTI
jgi:pimeloyl-ACP methyl ester carboxylesterase